MLNYVEFIPLILAQLRFCELYRTSEQCSYTKRISITKPLDSRFAIQRQRTTSYQTANMDENPLPRSNAALLSRSSLKLAFLEGIPRATKTHIHHLAKQGGHKCKLLQTYHLHNRFVPTVHEYTMVNTRVQIRSLIQSSMC